LIKKLEDAAIKEEQDRLVPLKDEGANTDHFDSDRDSFISGAVKEELHSDEEMVE
jgi:hypothetical protein